MFFEHVSLSYQLYVLRALLFGPPERPSDYPSHLCTPWQNGTVFLGSSLCNRYPTHDHTTEGKRVALQQRTSRRNHRQTSSNVFASRNENLESCAANLSPHPLASRWPQIATQPAAPFRRSRLKTLDISQSGLLSRIQ